LEEEKGMDKLIQNEDKHNGEIAVAQRHTNVDQESHISKLLKRWISNSGVQ
jgi:hypothetical protein